MIQLCPLTEIPKEEIIKIYKNTQEHPSEDGYSYFTHASSNNPNVCIGNCIECCNYKNITEKEYRFKKNDTFINHVKYEAEMFIQEYLFSLPITLILSFISYQNLKAAFLLSLAFASILRFLHFLVGFGNDSFEKWLEEKYERNLEDKQEE